ncbi:MAG TPA: PepSY-associated TM helix domain-containing protein [Novosphingobium sp.]|nr:PepSY-associated TM helix domain-containing protein [Novosphingobium sp.]
MRKWHRWISVFFGVFLLWIAVTGTLSQVVPMYIDATSAGASAEAPKPAVACPEGYTCRPKPKDGDPRALVGLLHHLHSGESFGALGVAIATLSGFAMIFFSFSGLWLYILMWRGRKDRGVKPAWFWK